MVQSYFTSFSIFLNFFSELFVHSLGLGARLEKSREWVPRLGEGVPANGSSWLRALIGMCIPVLPVVRCRDEMLATGFVWCLLRE
jgi:hypothetical protein